MIDEFEVGRWYVFDAGEDSGITWNLYGKMAILKDGKPHQCTAIRGDYPMYANFDGHTDGPYDGGTWSFDGDNAYVSEVKTPQELQFKRGDKILVTDHEYDNNWFEYIFVLYIEGATEPYVVTPADENDFRDGRPFKVYTYRYAKSLPAKDKKLAKLEENLRIAQEELEEYKKEKSK